MRTTVQKLRNERDAAGATQQQVADAMGIARTELSTALSGKLGRTVDPDFAKRYRAALAAISAAEQTARLQEAAK